MISNRIKIIIFNLLYYIIIIYFYKCIIYYISRKIIVCDNCLGKKE